MMTSSNAIKELSRVHLGDMVLLYQHHEENGQVQLSLIPKSKENQVCEHRSFLIDPEDPSLNPDNPQPAWVIDSLVQIRLSEDPGNVAFSNGHTMRNSQSTLDLKYVSQQVMDHSVVTELSTQNGLVCKHVVEWNPGESAIRMATQVFNERSTPITLEMISSFSLGGITPFHHQDAPERLQLHRARSYWAAEGRLESIPLEQLHMEPSYTAYGVATERFGQVGSMPTRGFFPFVALEDTHANVTWAAQIAWHGSWQMEAYRRDDFVQMSGGLADREFGHWTKSIEAGKSFTTPQAIVTVTHGDVEKACQRLTASHLFDAPKSEEELPIMFNEWCTTWGHPSHDNLIELADRLAGSHVKYLIIDDGWAERPTERMQENGDWIVDKQKFPLGLKATCDAIRERGLIPGIWFEFEVANKGSRAWYLTEHHLQRDGRVLDIGSRRFWDFRDPWVHEFLADRVIGLLQSTGMGYMKVDYNETIGLGCDGAESLGEGLRDHLMGVNTFFKKIRKECPDLVIEICSSGGMRLSPIMLEHSSMFSFSDAHETREMPIIAYNVQQQVPAKANQIWAVLRRNDSEQRLIYSLACTFLGRMCLSGDIYDLNPNQWNIALSAQSLYKKIAPIIASGTSTRFGTQQKSHRHPKGWQGVIRQSNSAEECLLVFHNFENTTDQQPEPISIPLPPGHWNIAGELAEHKNTVHISNGKVYVQLNKPYEALVAHLVKSSTVE